MDALLSSLNADTSTEGAQIQALDGDADSQNREAAPAVPQPTGQGGTTFNTATRQGPRNGRFGPDGRCYMANVNAINDGGRYAWLG